MIVFSATMAATLASGPVPAAAPLAYAMTDDQDAAAAPPAAASAQQPAPPPVPAPPPAPSTPAAAANAADHALANGEIVVSGERKMQKIDPIEGANKVSFEVLESVDKALVGPIATGYRKGLPKPVRTGLHNFFYNLTEPVNAINYVLQLHPGNALKTVARFGINSTVGVAGLIDVAKKKPFNIHYRPNGFANTLGYWGVGPGPYMFLPLVGPTSLRDVIGSLLDQATLPLIIKKPFNNFYYVTAAGVITQLDYRVIIDDDLNKVRKTSSPYSTYRQIYLKTRYEEIEALHGRGPLARGEVGEAPFAKPLYPEPETPAAAPAPAVPPAAAPVAPATPAPAEAAPAAPPTPAAAPPTPAAAPPTPPAPVFISEPVVQPIPAHP